MDVTRFTAVRRTVGGGSCVILIVGLVDTRDGPAGISVGIKAQEVQKFTIQQMLGISDRNQQGNSNWDVVPMR